MHKRGALDKLVARCREQTSFGNTGWIYTVAGSADALQGNCNRPWRTNLAYEIDCADINAKLQRGRRDNRAKRAILELFFSFQPQPPRKTSVVREHRIFAQAFAKMMCHAFRKSSGVHKYQSRPVSENELRNTVVDFPPHFIARYRSKFVFRDLDRNIQIATVSAVNDAGIK